MCFAGVFRGGRIVLLFLFFEFVDGINGWVCGRDVVDCSSCRRKGGLLRPMVQTPATLSAVPRDKKPHASVVSEDTVRLW